jgi:hypothetical protein
MHLLFLCEKQGFASPSKKQYVATVWEKRYLLLTNATLNESPLLIPSLHGLLLL